MNVNTINSGVNNNFKLILNFLKHTKEVYGDAKSRASIEEELYTKLAPLNQITKVFIKEIIFTFSKSDNDYIIEGIIDSPDLDFKKSQVAKNPSEALHLLCDDIIRFVRKHKEK
jgi:ribosome-associated translation inhibitor RaiA